MERSRLYKVMESRQAVCALLTIALFVTTGCEKQGAMKQQAPETQNNASQEKQPAKIATEMVLIPAGAFQMGSNDGAPDEQPVHSVGLDAFYMDRHEVTVGQYKQFLRATAQPAPDWGEVVQYSATDQHPMVYVSWYDAMAYAKWAGKTLPTEAQWEYAARGGLEGQTYPWGNGSPDKIRANYDDAGIGKTTLVGSYSQNGYGLHDMAGNVWEWCIDEYVADFYKTGPKKNPVSGGPISLLDDSFKDVKTRRVVRGGGWDAASRRLRVGYRDGNGPRGKVDSVGFRCVRPAMP